MKHPKNETDETAARNAAIYARKMAGEDLRDIARDVGLTRERVRQIVVAETLKARKAKRQAPSHPSQSRFSAENNDLSSGCDDCSVQSLDRRSARLLAAATRACAPKE